MMIDFNDVSYVYENGMQALNHVSFHIGKGEKVGLIGANGAGKSTLMKLMTGLLTAEGITVGGIPVTRQTVSSVRRKVGYVLQDSDQQMFMPRVYDDIAFGLKNAGLSREETDKRVDEVLDSLGISALRDRYNHRISGGEKKMAAIATILAMHPEVILMDEPASSLDPYNRRMIIRTIAALPETCLIASHDLDLILDICPRVILLDHGSLTADGETEKILQNRILLEQSHLELPLSLSRR